MSYYERRYFSCTFIFCEFLKLTISHLSYFAFLMLLPLCGMMKIIFKVYGNLSNAHYAKEYVQHENVCIHRICHRFEHRPRSNCRKWFFFCSVLRKIYF